jgi:hypothetical protein
MKQKGFRFYIPKFNIDLPKDKQAVVVFALCTELMQKVDQRIEWAKSRSQSEEWWDLDIRSCSAHYKLIDTFDIMMRSVRSDITFELLWALWSRVRRDYWSVTYSHLDKANEQVNRINQMFRPTREL